MRQDGGGGGVGAEVAVAFAREIVAELDDVDGGANDLQRHVDGPRQGLLDALLRTKRVDVSEIRPRVSLDELLGRQPEVVRPPLGLASFFPLLRRQLGGLLEQGSGHGDRCRRRGASRGRGGFRRQLVEEALQPVPGSHRLLTSNSILNFRKVW